MTTIQESPSAIAKQSFTVLNGSAVLSEGWYSRKSAVIVCQAHEQYARQINDALSLNAGFRVAQGGYDADSGDKLTRTVYPKRTAWRVL